MATTEKQLHIWVIRHLKPSCLPAQQSPVPRRHRLVGRSIQTDIKSDGELGIVIENDALMPFLLTIRATSHNPESRPVFAGYLASSYEAFLHTRSTDGAGSTDEDDDETHAFDIWRRGEKFTLGEEFR